MKHNASDTTPTDEEIASVAKAESLDVRTVIRALAGLPIRGIAGERAARAVAALRRARRPSTPPHAGKAA